mmetsp:Transcript_13713/g.11674  ORF Transcript_13713/g.11674 Transcript_13713/m.11674 type:complete len:245 (+) Transcript_13713:1023-1757(+)
MLFNNCLLLLEILVHFYLSALSIMDLLLDILHLYFIFFLQLINISISLVLNVGSFTIEIRGSFSLFFLNLSLMSLFLFKLLLVGFLLSQKNLFLVLLEEFNIFIVLLLLKLNLFLYFFESFILLSDSFLMLIILSLLKGSMVLVHQDLVIFHLSFLFSQLFVKLILPLLFVILLQVDLFLDLFLYIISLTILSLFLDCIGDIKVLNLLSILVNLLLVLEIFLFTDQEIIIIQLSLGRILLVLGL